MDFSSMYLGVWIVGKMKGNGRCVLCGNGTEDTEYFLIRCNEFEQLRREINFTRIDVPTIIGASLSEPHTSESNSALVSICIIIMVRTSYRI